jgi:hypothetical protein
MLLYPELAYFRFNTHALPESLSMEMFSPFGNQGAAKCKKSADKGQNLKKIRHLTQLAERFKTSTISWGFWGFVPCPDG